MVASNVEAPSAKRRQGERGPEVPILSRLQARNLYLNECLPYRTISERTGIPTVTLMRMASKEGWTAVRRAQKERLIAKQDARGNEMRDQVVDAIASASEQYAIRGLQRVGEALERTDRDAAKDFQALTAGVKNLATTARAMREPVGAGSSEQGPSAFNFFFIQPGAPVAHHEVKKVVEISATKP